MNMGLTNRRARAYYAERAKGGAIYIVGSIIDNSRTSPPNLVVLNMVYINLYDEGQAYTEQEHRDWLAEAGFKGFERIAVLVGGSIITARKPRLCHRLVPGHENEYLPGAGAPA
jgi:hypothetical protein